MAKGGKVEFVYEGRKGFVEEMLKSGGVAQLVRHKAEAVYVYANSHGKTESVYVIQPYISQYGIKCYRVGAYNIQAKYDDRKNHILVSGLKNARGV